MPQKKPRLWFSVFSPGFKPYAGEEPAFFSTSEFRWADELERSSEIIQAELRKYLSSDLGMKSYFHTGMVSDANSWKSVGLIAWGVKFHKRIKHFPETLKVLSRVEGLVSANFVKLGPGAKVKSHHGDTNGAVRVHLGLKIPGTLPEIGIRVRDEERSWEEGKLVIFCDAYEHSAWNATGEDRYILLMDVVRPEFISKKRFICGMVLGSLGLQVTLRWLSFLLLLLALPFYMIYMLYVAAAIVSTPVYNFFGKLFHRR